jgi:hypothetical protein
MGEDVQKLLEDADQYRRVMVEPVVNALRMELQLTVKPLVEKQGEQERRLGDAEKKVAELRALWGKVLVGFTVYSSVAAALVGIFIAKIRKWLGL